VNEEKKMRIEEENMKIINLWTEASKAVFEWVQRKDYSGLLAATEQFKHERRFLQPGRDFEYVKRLCKL
jgi:hypothetical protein